jgi:NTP pyrophosphatase (non-canonical NTP hydrolase)
MDKTEETLNILQEECAEVIQAVSKCQRFGIDNTHIKSGVSNRANLTEEVGDLICMVNLLVDQGVLKREELDRAAQGKLDKLRIWSTILS